MLRAFVRSASAHSKVQYSSVLVRRAVPRVRAESHSTTWFPRGGGKWIWEVEWVLLIDSVIDIVSLSFNFRHLCRESRRVVFAYGIVAQ